MHVERQLNHRVIPSLDGLRALSILLVFSGHALGTDGLPNNRYTSWLSPFAHLGVQIFFVISGFLITSLLLKEEARSGAVSLRRFYARRTLRIFPAAFAFITVMALVFHPHGLQYAYTYTMCYFEERSSWVIQHLWSLSVEEQFYLLWPLLFICGPRVRKQESSSFLLLQCSERSPGNMASVTSSTRS